MASLGFNEAVTDYRGHQVKPNRPYQIQVADQPAKWISRDKRTSDVMCPQVAVLSNFPIPVEILQESAADYVPVNSKISIRFEGGPPDPCPESGIWRVDKNTPFPKPDIPANGRAFAPDSTFMIQKTDNGYKFVYESNIIGVYPDPITRIGHLVLNPTPLDVIFVPPPFDAGNKTSGSS